MFTGIVQTRGRIVAIAEQASGKRLAVDPAGWEPAEARPVELGDSICLSGVCLTVADLADGYLHFDVIAETLACTTLGQKKAGQLLNLEPSVTPRQPMGGHFVQGHVEGLGRIVAVQSGEAEYRLTIQPPAELMDAIVPKGSITIDGVSMTLAAVHESTFEIALIPTTLASTTLGELGGGDQVNLETDLLNRAVVHWLRRQREQPSTISWQTLREAGMMDST